MKKILVIGQAPPAVQQGVPYDTTMLYDWLAEVGITKEKAQEIFDWDAVYDKFPGYDGKGHKLPTISQMDGYYTRELAKKIEEHNKILILGNVAKLYLSDKLTGKDYLCLIHPSKRNMDFYKKNKLSIITKLNFFINKT